MTYTIIGDVHATHKNLNQVQELFSQIEILGNTTIFLGDLLDTKEVIRGKCLNAFFDYFKSSKLTHIIVIGNHDYFNLECKDHSLKPLSSLSNVIIADRLTIFENMAFIPYSHDLDKLRSEIKEAKEENVKALFGHFDMVGFDYGNGRLCESGLTLKDFKNIPVVISGHFHKYQREKHFTYLGTPFSQSFGEANQDKYIATFDSESSEIKLIETLFPKHVSLDFKAYDYTHHQLIDFLNKNKDNKVRIRLFGSVEEVQSFPKDKYSEFNVKWEDKSVSENQTGTIEEYSDNKSQFVSWAKDIKKLDDDTVSLGLSILEALSAK